MRRKERIRYNPMRVSAWELKYNRLEKDANAVKPTAQKNTVSATTQAHSVDSSVDVKIATTLQSIKTTGIETEIQN